MARESLQGNYGTIISALLLYMLINFLINFVSNLLFRNGSTLTAVVSFLFSFVIVEGKQSNSSCIASNVGSKSQLSNRCLSRNSSAYFL